MKRNFTKEDIRKVLLQNYKEELKKVSKEYEKISLKQDNFKVLDYDFLHIYFKKDYTFLTSEKIKFDYHKEYVKKLENTIKYKILSDKEDFLDKNIKDLQFKIYQLEKHII